MFLVILTILSCMIQTGLRHPSLKSEAFPTTPGDHKLTIVSNGRTRHYLLHLPPSFNSEQATPLVIVLHGGGGNGENAAKMSRMSKKADEEGFVAVYPYGTGRFKQRLLTWNAGNCCGWALDNKTDDVDFIRSLLDTLVTHYPIDPKRVYATGISNGGMMLYVLACALSDKIAAIAPVAGAMNHPECKPAHPVSVIIFHGTEDEHVLYGGGAPLKRADPNPRIDNPVSFAVSFWIRQNKCSTRPIREEHGNVIRETYSGGDGRSAVVLYTIRAGKHAWPGGERGSIFGDEPTEELSATDAMWEFFKTHPKR